jgi:hypothetical protein
VGNYAQGGPDLGAAAILAGARVRLVVPGRLDAAGTQDLPYPLLGVAGPALDLCRSDPVLCRLHHRGVQLRPGGVRLLACRLDAALRRSLRRFDAGHGAAVLAYGGIKVHEAKCGNCPLDPNGATPRLDQTAG